MTRSATLFRFLMISSTLQLPQGGERVASSLRHQLPRFPQFTRVSVRLIHCLTSRLIFSLKLLPTPHALTKGSIECHHRN
ncbi:hypothetical protein B0T09DRAFT_343398, partial [Sordaria sp. MPI-SDFR-AT-0083]